jgi:hypothetical protein
MYVFVYMHVTWARMLERTGRSSWMMSSAPAHVVINAIANISMLTRVDTCQKRPIKEQKRPTDTWTMSARLDTCQKRPIKEQKRPADTRAMGTFTFANISMC